jgi:hypothetical protein
MNLLFSVTEPALSVVEGCLCVEVLIYAIASRVSISRARLRDVHLLPFLE